MYGGITPSSSARSSVTLTCFPINVCTSRLWEDMYLHYPTAANCTSRLSAGKKNVVEVRIESLCELKVKETRSAGVTDDTVRGHVGPRTGASRGLLPAAVASPRRRASNLTRPAKCRHMGHEDFLWQGSEGPTGFAALVWAVFTDERSRRVTGPRYRRQARVPDGVRQRHVRRRHKCSL